MALAVSFTTHGSPARKLFGRFTLIAVALLAQLILLLGLSYRPHALTQVINTNNNNNHFWNSRPAVPPYKDTSSSNDPPIIASDSAEETAKHAAVTTNPNAESGAGTKKKPATRKKRPGVVAKPPPKAAAGRKKILPTNLRDRPWTKATTGDPLIATRLCGDDGRLPVAADLAPIAATAGAAHGAGALVLPGVSHDHLVPGTQRSRGPKILLRTRDAVCAWLVVVDFGDAAAAAPWFGNISVVASGPDVAKNNGGSVDDNNRKRNDDENANGDGNEVSTDNANADIDNNGSDTNDGNGGETGNSDGNHETAIADAADRGDGNGDGKSIGTSDSVSNSDGNGEAQGNGNNGGNSNANDNGTGDANSNSDANDSGNSASAVAADGDRSGNGNDSGSNEVAANGESKSDENAKGNGEVAANGESNSDGNASGNIEATANLSTLTPLTFPPVAVGWPPDSVDLKAEGENYTVVFDTSQQYVIVNGRDSEVSYRIYNVTIDLRDPDSYQLEVVLEYMDYLWNYEDPAHVYWAPTPLPIFMNRDSLTLLPSSLRLLANDPVTHPQITYESFAALPLCSNGNHRGRWVPSAHLGFAPTLRMHVPSDMNENSNVDYDKSPLLLQNYDDAVWVPYDCRYAARTYDSWRDRCLLKHHPYVHYFGDSNIRRGLKALASGGRWCKIWYSEDSSQCQCSDWHLDIEGLAPDREDNLLRILSADDARNSPPDASSPPPPTPVAYAFLWKGLNSWGPNWSAAVDLTAQQQRLTNILPGAAQLAMHAPTAVIISLTNWDAAYGSLAEFLLSLPVLVAHLRETYTARGVPIVWRTGQHFAGRADQVDADGAAQGKQPRRFSRARVRAFDAAAERALVDGLGAVTWDVRAIGAALRPKGRERAAQCDSGHAGRDLVDTENTLLMNVLCNP
ncbi:hypothetical protein HDU87_002360 [Geranomyces variabilis]|uniref:Uncharacterized protein n=1 Tax=Geranomyces variabilis TaxID=109894 RepID=A0AAD5TMN4_9FUNG|nr:hypothetical protein HDU87_002360 [Geranomyces variabilis]